ncbi:hypothetical protein GCM10023115_11850 [Pontixanthobacter gangjinensis]|uniref:hypothetical protein n=1 Tax=Pontixanthobacter gangjinensis TaxID=1028742 RepID=UPI00192554D7|nr:hypothetical protein [Pontixanthobacter gangjinensis]
MMGSGSRLRQIGWMVALSICAAFFMALTFRVNAVKSEVRLAEREIIALENERIMLETEFQTRANQQQLADWNRIEFGYRAPDASQYVENERQLASLGLPRTSGAPDPIRVARAVEAEDDGFFPDLVSPMSGKPLGEQEGQDLPRDQSDGPDKARNPLSARRPLSERLSMGQALGNITTEAPE